MPFERRTFVVALLIALALAGCGKRDFGTTPSDTPPPSPTPAPTGTAIIALGDIGQSGGPVKEVSDLIKVWRKKFEKVYILLLGDLAYPHGSREDYATNLKPYYGSETDSLMQFLYPVPGNHEYDIPGVPYYFEFFRERVFTEEPGYYDFAAGPCHVIALNDNIPHRRGSAQYEWLRVKLESHPVRCTVVFWHKPRFSSSRNGDTQSLDDIWRLLYEHHVKFVLNGHEHLYARYAPQTPREEPDAVRGVEQFIVGTGGANLYGCEERGKKPGNEACIVEHGFLVLELGEAELTRRFVTLPAGVTKDEGKEAYR